MSAVKSLERRPITKQNSRLYTREHKKLQLMKLKCCKSSHTNDTIYDQSKQPTDSVHITEDIIVCHEPICCAQERHIVVSLPFEDSRD